MCTVISLSGNSFYFGRNMDIEGPFGEAVTVTPRRFSFELRKMSKIMTEYAIIGMAAEMDGYPLYADGMNEKGLCMAALHFVGYARYAPPDTESDVMLTPYELIPYLLGTCASCREVREATRGLRLVAIPFRNDVPLSPLHWIVADGEECLVIESTADGVFVWGNPTGILTNAPALPFHLQNVLKYKDLSVDTPPESALLGLGLGAVGLPGDYSSASRFVRANFLKSCVENAGACAPADVYRILGAVAPLRGCVRNGAGEWHATTYSSCMIPSEKIYSYTTAESLSVSAVRLTDKRVNGRSLVRIPLKRSGEMTFDDNLDA